MGLEAPVLLGKLVGTEFGVWSELFFVEKCLKLGLHLFIFDTAEHAQGAITVRRRRQTHPSRLCPFL